MALRPVDPQPDFPALERAVLERWRERDVFRASVERRRGAEPWVWYEGPPTANGLPGVHHVLARVFKDIFPRYRTMKGNLVERQGGWDCHGLPVEIAVEKELGFHGKPDIEAYGIAEFNAKCREAVLRNVDEWIALTDRIGMWVDIEHAYRTMDPAYVESVWWALKTLWERDLLYEGFKVVPYCAECGTTLSSHELGQPGAYREVEDPSVYVRLPVTVPSGPLEAGDELIVWTTTPWTLVSNAAVAVHPDLTYVRARVDDRVIVVADALLERLAPDGADILARFAGGDIAGTAYEPPFPFIGAEAYGPRGHTVLTADFVSADDGTGLVHTAIAFGEDDFRLGEQYGLNVVNPVRLDGTYDERIGPYAGRWVKDADPDLVEDLQARGRVFRAETFVHAYPHCWRSGTPLIYYAKPSWYIATTKLRDRLLAANEAVTWHPGHVKHGRFGHWLENNVDWALSRERYWGTPLPVWRCANDHVHAIGSFAELEELSGVALEDPHRPYVDEVGFPCPHCHERMERVPEVIDVWFDSGAMPFARLHAPHENAELFEARFPADFVCEGIDQTRGWFYSLLAEGALLFDSTAYRNVVCLGLIVDADGRKMSKSLGNAVEPWDVLERFGADALRWYFFTSKQPWDGYRFSYEAVGESVRLFLRRLWNVYHLYALYFEAGDIDLHAPGEPTELDRWIESRLAATVAEVDAALDVYDATAGGRALAGFVDEVSNWYVRRSRRRFWDGDPAAFRTLRECLVTTAKLLAPFCPFVADEIYDNLDGERESVHGADFPLPGPRDEALERDMATAREAVRLGHAARGGAKLKVRQPLRAAVVVADERERAAIERLAASVRDELNVRELRFVSAADELGSLEVKPNYRTLGPRFGRLMPDVARAVAGLDPGHVAAALREGRGVAVMVDGRDHELGADDLVTSMRPLEGYQVEREGSHAVALELALDEELRREGLAREIVHAVQAARKEAGLDVSDRIALKLGGDAEVLEAARAFEAYLAGETLAVSVSYDGNGSGRATSVEGRQLTIGVKRSQTR
jgi:isoleucyl-tRNA synthetase